MNDWLALPVFVAIVFIVAALEERAYKIRLAKRFRYEQEVVMEGLTTDPTDPRFGYGTNDEEVDQNETYLVMSEEERHAGYVRPVRMTYTHTTCGTTTTMGIQLAETYAANPSFYGATYCVHCRKHRPVGEFVWMDGTVVGS